MPTFPRPECPLSIIDIDLLTIDLPDGTYRFSLTDWFDVLTDRFSRVASSTPSPEGAARHLMLCRRLVCATTATSTLLFQLATGDHFADEVVLDQVIPWRQWRKCYSPLLGQMEQEQPTLIAGLRFADFRPESTLSAAVRVTRMARTTARYATLIAGMPFNPTVSDVEKTNGLWRTHSLIRKLRRDVAWLADLAAAADPASIAPPAKRTGTGLVSSTQVGRGQGAFAISRPPLTESGRDMLAFLATQQGGRTPKEIAVGASVAHGTARNLVRQLCRDGLIAGDGRKGGYVVTQAGRTAATACDSQ